MKCAICDGRTENVFTINSYGIVECDRCAHRMVDLSDLDVDVRKIYSEEYFMGGGIGYPNYLEEKDVLVRHGRYYGKLLSKYISQPGSILDVGAAAGYILKGLSDRGWKGEGVELNDTMAQYARNKLGLDVHTGDIESFSTNKRFDVISLVQVVAHLQRPRKVLEHLSNMLADTGFILVETWNYKSLTASFFGRRWHEYSPPSVLHWFSKQSLKLLMSDLGFDMVACGHPEKYISWKHAESLLSAKINGYPLSQFIRAMLSLVPGHLVVPYPAEDLLWVLFRKKMDVSRRSLAEFAKC